MTQTVGLLIGDDRGAVTALAGATGAVSWVLPVGRPVTVPLATVGAAVLVAAGSTVFRVDTATGVVAWGFPAPGQVRAVVTTSPVGAAVVCADGAVFGIDAETGAARWGTALPVTGPASSRVRDLAADAVLAPGGKTLLVADALGRLHALDLEAGALRWTAAAAPVSTAVTSVSLVVDGMHAHLAMPTGVLASVHVGTGAVAARAQVHTGPIGALAAAGGRVAVGIGDRVMCGIIEE